MANKQFVLKLLEKLIRLDVQTTQAYYEMGQILHSLFEGRLHTVLGYESYQHLVEGELSYTPSTSHRYRRVFKEFRRLHYNKAESLELMHKFGITRLLDVLPDMHSKTGARAIGNKIEALDQHQINFTLTTAEWKQCQCALVRGGATLTENGRYEHSTQAFMKMVREQNQKPALKIAS